MSRCVEFGPVGSNQERGLGSSARELTGRAALAVLVGVAGLTVLVAAPEAVATPTRSEVVVSPPLPSPESFPHQQLVLPALQLVFPTKDLRSNTKQSATADTLDVRLDANVAFGKDSAALRPVARERLTTLAAELAHRPPGTLAITGYTDDLGSAEHGLQLSRQRAQAVRDALGAAATRHTTTVTGRGEADPLVPNDSEPQRARNRRVEVHWQAKR